MGSSVKSRRTGTFWSPRRRGAGTPRELAGEDAGATWRGRLGCEFWLRLAASTSNRSNSGVAGEAPRTRMATWLQRTSNHATRLAATVPHTITNIADPVGRGSGGATAIVIAGVGSAAWVASVLSVPYSRTLTRGGAGTSSRARIHHAAPVGRASVGGNSSFTSTTSHRPYRTAARTLRRNTASSANTTAMSAADCHNIGNTMRENASPQTFNV